MGEHADKLILVVIPSLKLCYQGQNLFLGNFLLRNIFERH